jgi:predicted dehydrogenase
MTQGKVKIGIVGIGSMGSEHVDHVIALPNTELSAICDHSFTLLDADAYPDVPRYHEYERMLEAVELDAVIIATPHYDHPEMCRQAFERGLHVLVEKPIAVHVGAAQRLLDDARATRLDHPKLVFAAMFMQRTWGQWRAVKSIIEGGALGTLMRCTWIITDWFRTQYYFDSRPWRGAWASEGGGVLMNQCPHNLDLFQWLVGMPARVNGQVSFGKHHHIEVEDEVTAYFEYDNGLVGHFIASTGESPGANRLEIVGDCGKLVYEDEELVLYRNEWSSSKHIREAGKGAKLPVSRELVPFEARQTNQHEWVIENFVDAILNGAELIAPAEEGLNSVMLNNAIILSAHKQKTVSLPIDAQEYVDLLQAYIANPPHPSKP